MNPNTQPTQEELYATLRVLRNVYALLSEVRVGGADDVRAANEAFGFISAMIKKAEASLPAQEETPTKSN